jgi:ureidoacrylate peracid hydrolase
MNGLTIPDSVTPQVMARCGDAHPHRDLDPARTALIVVDLPNAFMDDGVGHAVCPAARDILPHVNPLAATVRMTGDGVFWIKTICDDHALGEWSNAHAVLTPAARQRSDALVLRRQ